MPSLTCWTASDLETQPHVRRSTSGGIDVALIVGVWSSVPFEIELQVQAEVSVDAGVSPAVVSVDPATVTCTELTLASLAERDHDANDAMAAHQWLEATRHLGDVRIHLQRQAECAAQNSPDPLYPRTRFYEVTLENLPAGQLLRVVTVASITHTQVRATAVPAGLWLVDPDFEASDVVATRTFDNTICDDQWWVLMHRREAGFDHLRLDLLRTANLTRRPGPASNLAPISVTVDGQTFDVTRPPLVGEGALSGEFVGVRVDRSTDSILLTRRTDGRPLPVVTVTTRTDNAVPDQVRVDLPQGRSDYAPVSVMLIAYAIQGLNDLFTAPLDRYDPPRSFAEVAYSDELALFSGRPETQENAVGDGYRFVLGAQRGYGVKAVWTFNAGALLLLKHSLPSEWFAELTAAVHDRLISVGNAGLGAHRNSCYQKQTNVEEIERADTLLQRILTHDGSPATTNKIYFPDSRIYQARAREVDAYVELKADGIVDYIVLDRSTVAHRNVRGAEELYFGNDTPRRDDGNYLWADSTTDLNLLLIEDRLRDLLVAGSDDEVPRGQLHYELRRMFMLALSQNRSQRLSHQLPPKLFCFGDDIDHLAGNGWFDGNYRDRKSYSNAFLSAMCWLHTHPWMRARTADEPGFADEFLRRDQSLTVSSAIDATMDSGGAATLLPSQTEAIHFNSWYKAWAATPAPWLGLTLGTLSDGIENQLVNWPAEHHNELYDIAWHYFLSCTHESMWSKEPIDPDRRAARADLSAPFRWEPEDFAISETLQMRNAWVYLNASVWATWAADHPAGGSYLLAPETVSDPTRSGPLLERLRAAHGADGWWPGAPADSHGLYWDHDNLTNIVLYNAEVLVVLDRNGGRVTQLFAQVNGRPVSVSGTNKAYQFLAVGPPQVACDGQRLQNTVFTPNHAYLATDVREATWQPGTYQDQRGTAGPNPTWLPDNFNAYACRALVQRGRAAVECRYDQTPAGERPAVDVLAWDGTDGVGAWSALDGQRLRRGESPLVWHDFPGFTKTIELDGHQLRIRYSETQPGHLVANEFSVDLLDQLSGGERQERAVNRRTATVTSSTADRLRVTVKLGRNCDFTHQTRQPDGPGRRVLTDDIQIVSAAGGSFDYTVELPH